MAVRRPATTSAHAFATDPTAIFIVARATAAVLGTAAVGFVYLTGARLYDRRVGLLAGAVMAVSFLAVFYSHLALNDVPALLPLACPSTAARACWCMDGGATTRSPPPALGLAAATKYTAGIAVLPLAAAIVGRAVSVPADRRRVLGGAGLAAALAVAVFIAANPHAVLSFDEFWDDLRRQQEQAASGFGKLGLDYDSGIVYYLWALTWGLGWVPLAAAALGAVVALRRGRVARALMLVPWPVVFTLYMGLQDRFFGRWLLPAFPALALLAGVGGRVAGRPAARAAGTRRAALAALSTALRRPRGSSTRFTWTGCSRATTPATSCATGWPRTCPPARRSWSSRSSPTRGSRTSAGAPRWRRPCARAPRARAGGGSSSRPAAPPSIRPGPRRPRRQGPAS